MFSELKDDEIYVINPWYRLRNEKDYVLVDTAEFGKNFRLHHSNAIVLALCDGKRTVSDISRLAVPLVRSPRVDNVLEEARKHVRVTIDAFRRGMTNAQEQTDENNPYETPLIPIPYLSKFSPLQPPLYDPKQFYPRNAFPNGSNEIFVRERVPTSIFWHVTSDCSTDCQYCYLGRRRISHSKLLPKQRMLELIQEAATIGVLHLVISGGDAILYPYLFDFLSKVHTYDFSPVYISTKTFISHEMATRLAQYSRIARIQFSLDSNVEDVADYLVRSPGFYRRAIKSIQNMLDVGINVEVKAVITPYNMCTIPRFYREIKRMGVNTIRLATYSRSGYHHRDGLFNHKEDYDWLDKQLDLLREEFPNDEIFYQNGTPQTVVASSEERHILWQKRARCSAGRTQMMICSDGKVIPCEQLPEIEEIFVGDLTHQSIEEVWNSKKFDEIAIHFPKEKYQNTVCYDCDEFEKCHTEMGYCTRDTYISYGTIYEAPPTCPKQNSFVRFI